LRFRAIARRDKLLRLWAARQLGKSGTEAEAYAGVIRKVVGDLDAAGVLVEEGQLRRVLERLMDHAIEQIRIHNSSMERQTLEVGILPSGCTFRAEPRSLHLS
jgi:hypothetical protein